MAELGVRFRGDGPLRDARIASEIFDREGSLVWCGATSMALITTVSGLPEDVYVLRAHLPGGRAVSSQVDLRRDVTATLDVPADHLWAFAPIEPALLTGSSTTCWLPRRAEWKPWFVDIQAARHGYVVDPPAAQSTSEHGWLSVRDGIVAIPLGGGANAVLDDAMIRAIVRTDNGDADALMRYLQAGEFEWAAIIAHDFIASGSFEGRGALRSLESRTASAAIGYYVLRALDLETFEGEFPLLRDWCTTPFHLLPDSPDAAVIKGWYELRSGLYHDAAGSFYEACVRGVPMYTMGLRYLLDGVRLLEDRDFSRPTEFEWIVDQARGADWRAMLTTLHRTQPAPKPTSIGPFGTALYGRGFVTATPTWKPRVDPNAADTIVRLRELYGEDAMSSFTAALAEVSAKPYESPRAQDYYVTTMIVDDQTVRMFYDIDTVEQAITVASVDAAELLPPTMLA